ncbi:MULTISPECIES: head-tail connector protein [unclassified Virgibacillus]|uniref:head-tail connector protein n=1 Tax=unclassified Virgibacillus TaxID=2620237 RepID=UPI00090A88E7|nr:MULTISPECIES: head-tail connector protein [unclassified Virgibacillus]API92713.1 hypothetical protein BKP57_13395 [Virgibacillus sp. 6R]MBS7428209.1 head-tail connector protein [Virgibacillus sp. 19R1-5]
MLDLERIKGHLRIPHNLEDTEIQDYLEFAKQDVIEAVFDSQDPNLDMPKLEEDKIYQRAVIMLTTYYYENRMAVSEVSQHESPFSVTHAIQTLRAHRDRYLCD